MTRDEQDPGDTAMINACQMIRGATEAGEMDLWYKLNYKNCLHRLDRMILSFYYRILKYYLAIFLHL